MYLHLGQSVVVPFRDVIGVFDMDNTTSSHLPRKFLEPCAGPGMERRWSISPNSPRPPCSSGWRTIYLNEKARRQVLFEHKRNRAAVRV